MDAAERRVYDLQKSIDTMNRCPPIEHCDGETIRINLWHKDSNGEYVNGANASMYGDDPLFRYDPSTVLYRDLTISNQACVELRINSYVVTFDGLTIGGLLDVALSEYLSNDGPDCVLIDTLDAHDLVSATNGLRADASLALTKARKELRACRKANELLHDYPPTSRLFKTRTIHAWYPSEDDEDIYVKMNFSQSYDKDKVLHRDVKVVDAKDVCVNMQYTIKGHDTYDRTLELHRDEGFTLGDIMDEIMASYQDLIDEGLDIMDFFIIGLVTEDDTHFSVHSVYTIPIHSVYTIPTRYTPPLY